MTSFNAMPTAAIKMKFGLNLDGGIRVDLIAGNGGGATVVGDSVLLYPMMTLKKANTDPEREILMEAAA